MKIKLVKEISNGEIKSYLCFNGVITHGGAEPVDLMIPLEETPTSIQLMFQHLSVLTEGHEYYCSPGTGEEH